MKKIILTFAAVLLLSNLIFAQIFTEQTDIVIPGIRSGSVKWGDYNSDGDLDFMITGDAHENLVYYSAICKNNGDNSFTETANILSEVKKSSLDWGDYNNDNYIDILLSGVHYYASTYELYSEIYKNNADETFTNQEYINLTKIGSGTLKWGDFDNDGYNDILLTGFNNIYNYISKIYKNNTNNTFTEMSNIDIEGVNFSSADWGDYNNDGLLDFIVMGRATDSWTTKIYKNNGDNTFSYQEEIEITGVSFGSVQWGDYNNNGYLDILIAGNRERMIG